MRRMKVDDEIRVACFKEGCERAHAGSSTLPSLCAVYGRKCGPWMRHKSRAIHARGDVPLLLGLKAFSDSSPSPTLHMRNGVTVTAGTLQPQRRFGQHLSTLHCKPL